MKFCFGDILWDRVLYNCTSSPADDAIIHYFNSFHTEKVEIPVKSELPVTVKACTFEEQIKGVALSKYFHVLLPIYFYFFL